MPASRNVIAAIACLVVPSLLALCAPASADASGMRADPVVDVDGNVYGTIRIGSQIWMAENLRTTRLNDGTPIPLVTDDREWGNLRGPGYCWPGNDAANRDAYGVLYNWHAVGTGKLAPAGWHVPTDEEWRVLAEHLGGTAIAGGKLKDTATAYWKGPNGGATNETGFSGRGAGVRNSDGTFGFFRELLKLWTSTRGGAHASDAVYWGLGFFDAVLGRSSHQPVDGHSVRCVRDR